MNVTNSAKARATAPIIVAAMAIPRPGGSTGEDRILTQETMPPIMPRGAARTLIGAAPTISSKALSEKKQATEASNDLLGGLVVLGSDAIWPDCIGAATYSLCRCPKEMSMSYRPAWSVPPTNDNVP